MDLSKNALIFLRQSDWSYLHSDDMNYIAENLNLAIQTVG